ncbi:MAG: hypothetical protein KKB51_06635 [Candidatus Riflebacteria bacterium]|nr:hypothetical protein [Candidatus Riflebacteria bacterium]
MLQFKGTFSAKPPSALLSRRGFVLFLVCTLALVMMIMIISLSSQKSGAVLQLTKTIEQERAVALAQAGVNEMLAWVKAGVNDKNSAVGSSIYQFWKTKPPVAGSRVIYSAEFSPAQLKMSNQLVDEYLGNRGYVSGQISLVVTERINGARPSFIGHIELVGKAKYKDFPAETKVKEWREIKIVDLSDPFLDKYALFVKSFCLSLNNPKKRIIIQGITPDDPTRYSFAYLGNRSYPACTEFPQGDKSANAPPVILDLDFKEDRNLLGNFYRPAPFQMANNQYVQASTGNLFFVNPPFNFAGIAGSFSLADDFHKTPELVTIYKSIVDSSRPYADTEGTLGYVVCKDYQSSGGNPAASQVFRALVSTLMQNWKYQYGYSDFLSITGGSQPFANEHPFSGIINYFEDIKQSNSSRTFGGKMPLLFGENRDTPVYVEGPVFLRFFKVAFVDQVEVKFTLNGGQTLDVPFPTVPMHYEKAPETFCGKTLSPPVDSRTDKLMSMPIEHFSINNFFFGAGTTPAKTPTAVKGGVEGYDVFPTIDESLQTVSHFYQTAEEFSNDRIKIINGQKILDLDGNMLIMGGSAHVLNLASVNKYSGKGKIIVAEGSCHLGNLAPVSSSKDSLGIYLMAGRFVLKSDDTANIFASLVATTCFSNNSNTSASAEGGIDFDGKSANIFGNLVVDNLFEMVNMPDGGHLKIVHDPGLYFPEYPVRVSVGQVRSLLAVDYNVQ